MTWMTAQPDESVRSVDGRAWVKPWIGGQWRCTVWPSPAARIEHHAPTIEEAKAWCERTLEPNGGPQ